MFLLFSLDISRVCFLFGCFTGLFFGKCAEQWRTFVDSCHSGNILDLKPLLKNGDFCKSFSFFSGFILLCICDGHWLILN